MDQLLLRDPNEAGDDEVDVHVSWHRDVDDREDDRQDPLHSLHLARLWPFNRGSTAPPACARHLQPLQRNRGNDDRRERDSRFPAEAGAAKRICEIDSDRHELAMRMLNREVSLDA
jgi:hypothetical protein